MKAIAHVKYGSPDDLQLQEVAVPTVGDDDVLVLVRAASVNALDWHIMRGMPYLVRLVEGVRRPKRPALGVDLAGVVEAVGTNVTRFRPGDAVFGAQRGAFAEYVVAPEHDLVRKLPDLTFEQAAAIPTAAITALQALRDKGAIQPGQRVLINGAGGGVGTFAVQIARSFGARVTAVCGTGNVETVGSIGAERVVDYTRDDFTRTEERYDLILDVAASRSLAELKRLLTPTGTLVLVGASPGQWIGPVARPLKAAVVSRFGSQTMRTLLARHKQEDLALLKELAERGALVPVIDRAYPLSQTVDAIRYLEAGHARGKVVITV